MPPMLGNNRSDGRRRVDVQREMLEDVVLQLPPYFVCVFGDETYSSHFSTKGDAEEFVESLLGAGVHPENIAFYHREKSSELVYH
ncbi:MAG: hypothetical protein NUW37_14725 [Planctomycetes bacterium]|nr:hypothetical protein [Planctomycetota bacterium]